MSERPKTPWFRVAKEADLDVLKRRLLGLYHYNTWSSQHRDKNGNRISMVGYDWKPDSDWGKVDPQLNVWFASDALADAGEALIEKHQHQGKST